MARHEACAAQVTAPDSERMATVTTVGALTTFMTRRARATSALRPVPMRMTELDSKRT